MLNVQRKAVGLKVNRSLVAFLSKDVMFSTGPQGLKSKLRSQDDCFNESFKCLDYRLFFLGHNF